MASVEVYPQFSTEERARRDGRILSPGTDIQQSVSRDVVAAIMAEAIGASVPRDDRGRVIYEGNFNE